MKTNMTFKEMRGLFVAHFNEMCKDSNLFTVSVDKDEMWELYLNSIPAEKNPIYRKRREFDCSCCRHFIKSFGNVVAIKDNKVISIWDFNTDDDTFQPMLNAMSDYIFSKQIDSFYLSNDVEIGTPYSQEFNAEYKLITSFNHFCIELPERFVNDSIHSINTVIGELNDIKKVFKRSLNEISIDSVDVLLELISQNSLYKGSEWKIALTVFKRLKLNFDALETETEKDLFAWEHAETAGAIVGKIRNHSIGTLLLDISNGVDLDEAVRRYEKIVAPSNYKRPKAIYTQKMLDEAKNTITELGYLDSLYRRYAQLDDITVNNILFCNKNLKKELYGVNDIFAEMSKSVAIDAKKFSRVEEVSIDKFINDILPNANEVELYFENRLSNNMVSLIAPVNKNSKTMFKWDNNFSWAYTGNITDSMKERVKQAGGHVDGDLRFSIQWNDLSQYNKNDLDAHCIEPYGYEIQYTNKGMLSPNKGMLDVDIINPDKNVPAVENIIYKDRNYMDDGIYTFYVHCFSYRGGTDGFRAEIEFDGQIYSFDYSKDLHGGEKVPVADVTLKDGHFTIKNLLKSNVSVKEVWNLNTNTFVPVSVIMMSPNYWNEQKGIGNKHYFFMLKDCINPESPNGFFNEYLKEELMQHKRVFEALGSKLKVADSDKQLSGVGFSSTQRNNVVVKIKGATERVLKIKF